MAFTEEEILALTLEKVKIAKPFITKREDKKNPHNVTKEVLPEFYPGYNFLVNQYKDILPHSTHGAFPESLFDERAPNQEQKEFEYLKANYKSTTIPVFMDYVNTVSRPFHNSNWSIEYKKDEPMFEDQSFQFYVENEIHGFGSLENFMRTMIPTLKAKDAEGVIAVKPLRLPIAKNTDGEDIISETELVDPQPVYYNVEQVTSFSQDHALILLEEKSIVLEGQKRVRKGLVFEFYDDENIWRVIQVGKRIEFNFITELFFEHALEQLPVFKLMGVPQQMEARIKYHSPFLTAVPNLDLVLLNQSYLQAAINKSVYPYRIMIGQECDFVDNDGSRCEDGRIIEFGGDGDKDISRTCPSCNGSGLNSRISPLGELLLKPDDGREGDMIKPNEALTYVAPPTDTLKFLRSEIAENENKGKQILHLQSTDTKVQPAQDVTATKALTDFKALAAFVAPISNQTFNLYANLLKAIGIMRYGDDHKKPDLKAPITFDFSTESDYIERLRVAHEADAAPIVIIQIIKEFLGTIYFSDEEEGRVFRLIMEADELLSLSNDVISMKLARGTVTKAQELIHCTPLTLISELEAKDENFFDQDIETQVLQLTELAKARVASIQAETTSNTVNDIAGGPSGES